MSETYLLGRNYLASARLNLQHHLWREAIGYNLHPLIPTACPEDAKSLHIADVGAGTGIWLLEVASSLSGDSQLVGFDISTEQFPHEKSVPSNVSFHALDATVDPPNEWREKFDIVHLRMLYSIVQNNDPGKVLNHCMKLLKPGGYIQWDEFDPLALQAVPCNAEAPIPGLQTLANIFTYTVPVQWISSLPTIYQNHNLNFFANESRNEKLWQRHAMMDIWCLVADEYASKLTQTESHQKAAEVSRAAQMAAEEVRSGSYYSQTWRIAVGRRPL